MSPIHSQIEHVLTQGSCRSSSHRWSSVGDLSPFLSQTFSMLSSQCFLLWFLQFCFDRYDCELFQALQSCFKWLQGSEAESCSLQKKSNRSNSFVIVMILTYMICQLDSKKAHVIDHDDRDVEDDNNDSDDNHNPSVPAVILRKILDSESGVAAFL